MRVELSRLSLEAGNQLDGGGYIDRSVQVPQVVSSRIFQPHHPSQPLLT